VVISWAWEPFDKGGGCERRERRQDGEAETATMIDARSKGKERRREKTVEGEMSHMMAW
jgi:hypothetical protein